KHFDRKPPDRKTPDRKPPDRKRPDPPLAATPASQDPRLSKRMSELGLCSRREADEWIENGWVRVNGEIVTTLGVRVPPDAKIEVEAAATRHQSEQVTILL